MEQSLKNLAVLITRPTHQAASLCELVEQHGGIPLLFSSLEITKPDNEQAIYEFIEQINQFDIIIFTSINAVEKAFFYGLHLPDNVAIFAVGAATSQALASQGIKKVNVPPNEFNSEALLLMPELQNIRDKKIAIISGEGGRNLLQSELCSRGADVSKIIVYQRQRPQIDIQPYLSDWQQQSHFMVVSTSLESLENLIYLVGDNNRSWLMMQPLLVISARMAEAAPRLGFINKPIIASTASDQGILESLIKWYSSILKAF